VQRGWYDRRRRRIRDLGCGDLRIYLDLEVRRVACPRCGTVKREPLAFLADNPFYTKRFAFYVGPRCRASPIRDVAKELRLDWHTVKALEQQYMREQLRRAGTPGPRVIGLDEVSIKKGHTYRIVVSDLVRHRPIWFGGQDRSEASLDEFYAWLGARKTARIRLVVMDMWKPFRLATTRHAPQASILFDKFHVLRHLGDALDQIRKHEYARVSGRQRRDAQRSPRGGAPRHSEKRGRRIEGVEPLDLNPVVREIETGAGADLDDGPGGQRDDPGSLGRRGLDPHGQVDQRGQDMSLVGVHRAPVQLSRRGLRVRRAVAPEEMSGGRHAARSVRHARQPGLVSPGRRSTFTRRYVRGRRRDTCGSQRATKIPRLPFLSHENT
jgi:Transposase/Helix-turn-helix domain of transposase family ISL3